MISPTVIPSTREHALAMAPRLRAADKAEVAAMSGRYPVNALLAGLEGDVCLTAASPQGDPILMFGVAPSRFPDAGFLWMLATDDILKHRFQFLRQSPAYVDSLHDFYPLLHNYVDARNELHIRWLEWIGCTFIKTHTRMGVQRRPFHEFVRIRKSHV